ncbi:hypothetical protein SAMN05444344_1504 [Tenacibaculum mesophilum]|uniref:DUF4836 family protein n=1 Tax=Tenacibaculum mesophilum TaxID=104268 RepID=A0ABM7CG61_9FLAO|nr:hypothetical protein [Tenacibaculum mesophilum]AZJ32758.1 hypothetical protein D6200_09390 [Tenacibaculum mesophilum]QFS28007.1 hypothetical protein F9Y86_06220 [Tenacibaculum mesophilum]SHF74892.1 hypothetical protein SAMN05444344_1504 [Tenacibaculum mesophilum]
MKKIIATLLFLNILTVIQAQRLESKIPNNIDVLVSANAENLFKLIEVSDIDKNAIGKEILKDINRRRDEDKVSSVANAGIDIKSNAYYFFTKTDSISYHNFYVELKDRELFESMLSKRNKKKIRRMEGYNIIEGRSDIRIWNDNYLLLVNGDASRGYFSTHKERLDKLKEEGEFGYNFRKRIGKDWTKKYVLDLFNKNVIMSIATNKKFQKSKKKNASATLWIRNYGMLMTDLFKSFGGYLYPMYAEGGNQNIYGVEEVTANLFFDKSDARILLDMSVSSDMKKSFKKIYNKKMSSNLVNSFDHDKALAFWSISIDTEETLKEYPELLHKMYGGILPKFQEEMELVGDLFSLVIDEKAVGRLVTGDALLVLNDFSKQEVEYTTYEYDKDYKRKEVTKTKEEFIPDFTLMIGSEEEDLLNKFFKLGEKHKAVEIENNVVKFKTKKSDIPFDLYSVVKNDVLYLTTSKTNALSIASGNNNFNTKKHSKLVRDNSTVLFVDVNAVLNKIPNKWMSKSEKEAMRFSTDNLNDGVFRVSRMKGNTISSELKISTQGTEENTLKLLLEFINTVAK